MILRFNDNAETLPGVHRAHIEEGFFDRVVSGRGESRVDQGGLLDRVVSGLLMMGKEKDVDDGKGRLL